MKLTFYQRLNENLIMQDYNLLWTIAKGWIIQLISTCGRLNIVQNSISYSMFNSIIVILENSQSLKKAQMHMMALQSLGQKYWPTCTLCIKTGSALDSIKNKKAYKAFTLCSQFLTILIFYIKAEIKKLYSHSFQSSKSVHAFFSIINSIINTF